MQVNCFDREHPLAGQVREVQHGFTRRLTNQRDVEYVPTLATDCDGFRQDETVSLGGADVVDQDGSRGRVTDVDKTAAILGVVDDEVL